MNLLVIGNATLDVICKTVNDVPRHDSIAFDEVAVTPGGCGSNVALGLGALGISVGLAAHIGQDDAAELVLRYWQRAGVDCRFVAQIPGRPTGTSIGLVDDEKQPRFIHTSGANASLRVADLDPARYAQAGVKMIHVAGYFVLPGLLDARLGEKLAAAKTLGMGTSLDVVHSPQMAHPEPLWPCLPYLDILLCNQVEASRISGKDGPVEAARAFLSKGAGSVIVKLGRRGCLLVQEGLALQIPAEDVEAIDTTGAGDAFAAGMLAARLGGASLIEACRAGNAAGARIVQHLGAVQGWLDAA